MNGAGLEQKVFFGGGDELGSGLEDQQDGEIDKKVRMIKVVKVEER